MTKQPYKLSFYESGYINPEEFEAKQFIVDYKVISDLLVANSFPDTEEQKLYAKHIKFYGCLGVFEPIEGCDCGCNDN